MQTKQPSFITLLLMISFASVNAVLFTPALPAIATFFHISAHSAQLTMSWFLIGYALGQLIYGPLANRFGRKKALYAGICLQILSCLLCVSAGLLHCYLLLVFARFMTALGAGVGLKMTFTLINECYEPHIATRKTAQLIAAFAITPGLGVALGGFLTSHFGWMSCFYAAMMYGLILLGLTARLPETHLAKDYNALKLSHLIHAYQAQFSNQRLLTGALLMGCCTCFVYVFAAAAPFIAINIFGMSSSQYGIANLLPPLGILAGSLACTHLANGKRPEFIIQIGIGLAALATCLMLLLLLVWRLPALYSLFLPTIIIYFALSLILTHASALAMRQVQDKAHASAVMNFINMSTATMAVLSLGLFTLTSALLPLTYLIICGVMILLLPYLNYLQQQILI